MEMPGRIKSLRESLGMTQQDVAGKVGVTFQAVQRWEYGTSMPKGLHLVKLCEALQTTERWILTGTGPMKAEQSLSDMGMVLDARYAPGDPRAKGAAQLRTHFTPIPKVTGFLSGGPGSWELSPEVEQYYAFRTDWLKSKGQPAHMRLMQVKGDSMYPTLHNGDYVLVDESQTTPLDGRIMALNLSGEAVVKRIRIELDGRISVLSDNGEVRGPCKPDEITILGKVVWLGREL